MKRSIYFLLILCLVVSCSTEEVITTDIREDNTIEPIINPSGTYNLFHGGQNRTYHYYQSIDLPEDAPLIFVLHGYNANAEDFMDWLSMKELAKEHGFAVVYPQGLIDNSRQTHWNADLTISNIDDVGFLSKLALHLQETYDLDSERTFISGFSNGGFMSYEMIVKRPGVFRAAASIQGTMSLETWNNRSLAEPISILQLSGGLDRIVPPNGISSTFGGWGGAPAIQEIMEFWAELNDAETQEIIDQDQTKVSKFINTENGSQIWYYLIKNLDHRIPLGDNYDVDTPTLIWEFFSSY